MKETAITVVGLPLDTADLTARATSALRGATVVVGAPRHQDLTRTFTESAEHLPLPQPLREGLPELMERAEAGDYVVVLGSGDPLWHGIGTTLVDVLGADHVRVLPSSSAKTLACAALRWSGLEVRTVSLMRADAPAMVDQLVDPGQLLVLSRDGNSPSTIAQELCNKGAQDRVMTICENLGGTAENLTTATASDVAGRQFAALNVVGLHSVTADAQHQDFISAAASLAPGAPESAYDTDGQITKREVRASLIGHLRPLPGQTLWDVGAGSGSVGVEWLRLARGGRVHAIEPKEERQERIYHNAAAFGLTGLTVVKGAAPTALENLPAPDTIFIGGGFTEPGLVEACWIALRSGGTLAATAVTLESAAKLTTWRKQVGGHLTKLSVSHAEPVGTFTRWQPTSPIILWVAHKP